VLGLVASDSSVPSAQTGLTDPIVFVSRAIPPDGSDFMRLSDADRGMPGAGGRERFRVARPGRLLVREANGTIRALVDGANPTAASANLIDVSAPAVSWDATKIAFAGLPAPPAGQVDDPGPHVNPGRWRIFTINADGSGLRQITFNDPALDAIDMSAYGSAGARWRYDDTDPAWLPDGRIVFSSTRWMGIGEYGAAPRTTNLHVVNPDGSGERRITSERNGADRPIVDPLTGRIVFARWWLNGRFPTDRTDTVQGPDRGGYPSYEFKDGLTHQGQAPSSSGGPGTVDANDWIATSVRPDGTDLQLWTGSIRTFFLQNNYYGGAFTNDGVLYGNFFPDFPLTESGGFGGIRRYRRGAVGSEGIWGLTVKTDDFVRKEDPVSLTIIHSATGYAADPVPLPDGRLLFSWARDPATGREDIGQDYGLFIINPNNPSNPTLVYDVRGTTELRAQLLRPRPVPPALTDGPTDRPTPTPIASTSDLHRDGTFVFDALNVYFNGPVDMPIVNAPTVGSAVKMRFFADYQRRPLNSDMTLNYPVLMTELPVPASGAVRHTAPANVSLFEDMRTSTQALPLTTLDGRPNGGAYVTGFNYGRPGTTVRCVGCHAGHTQIPVPATAEEARWTNLAPGARVTASSTSGAGAGNLVNRRALREGVGEHWRSQQGLTTGQSVDLEFPVSVIVRTVRLYGSSDGTLVRRATVRVFSDTARSNQIGQAEGADIARTGTNVAFADLTARVVRVTFDSVQGTAASLAEIEVIAAGGGTSTTEPPPTSGGRPSAPRGVRVGQRR
jgi:hypothetical protein